MTNETQPVTAAIGLIRKRMDERNLPGCFSQPMWHEIDTLLRYIDQQAERITVIEQKDRIKTVEHNVLVKENRELSALMAQLQSVPEERREIAERQHTRWEIEREHGQMFVSAISDLDTLLQDAARYRNAHDVLLAERNDAIAKRMATFERAGGLEKRIEQLEAALREAQDAFVNKSAENLTARQFLQFVVDDYRAYEIGNEPTPGLDCVQRIEIFLSAALAAADGQKQTQEALSNTAEFHHWQEGDDADRGWVFGEIRSGGRVCIRAGAKSVFLANYSAAALGQWLQLATNSSSKNNEISGSQPSELAGETKTPTGRTPEQYAIEHGRYLATAAQGFMDACNALFTAEQELDKAEPDTQAEVDDLISKVESAQGIRGERWRALERAIYEFTKRADRAYQIAQPTDAAQSAAYAVCKGEQ